MKRLLLAIPLLWHLSGVAGLAAMVCASAVPMQCACCQGQHATPTVHSSAANCPCKIAPKPRDAQPSAVATEQAPSPRPLPVAAAMLPGASDASVASLSGSLPTHADLSPPYLTAAPPRC